MKSKSRYGENAKQSERSIFPKMAKQMKKECVRNNEIIKWVSKRKIDG